MSLRGCAVSVSVETKPFRTKAANVCLCPMSIRVRWLEIISWNFQILFHEMTSNHSFIGTIREQMRLDERASKVDKCR